MPFKDVIVRERLAEIGPDKLLILQDISYSCQNTIMSNFFLEF